MIGIWSGGAQQFLLVLAVSTTLFFAIPIPGHTDLAVYFGRCLGAFVLMMELMMLRAGLNGTGIPMVFEIMTIIWVFMIVVHVWGWLAKIQPITETLEIGFWVLLLALTLAFWPS